MSWPGLYGYVVTRQESRYLDLIEEGDAALARDDSLAAIEAFTVAIAIKADSMAGHLKRGEAYRRRKEYESALKDLRRAADLDPLAPHPREILGDVSAAMGHDSDAVDRYREYLALDDRAPRVCTNSPSRNWRAVRRPPPKRHYVARWSSTIVLPRRITCWAFRFMSCSGRGRPLSRSGKPLI